MPEPQTEAGNRDWSVLTNPGGREERDVLWGQLDRAYERGRDAALDEAEDAVNGKAYGDAVNAIRALKERLKDGPNPDREGRSARARHRDHLAPPQSPDREAVRRSATG